MRRLSIQTQRGIGVPAAGDGGDGGGAAEGCGEEGGAGGEGGLRAKVAEFDAAAQIHYMQFRDMTRHVEALGALCLIYTYIHLERDHRVHRLPHALGTPLHMLTVYIHIGEALGAL